ncbi:EamA family transporter [Paenibacillaceae bacterium]|nr:EamA family transporter [Paenibacillaceae bacterium]
MWFVFAAAAAACFGLRGILYHWTAQRPIDRNLLLLAVYFSGTVIAFGINMFVGQQWTSGVMLGLMMGLFSYIANASMYRGYAVGKASLVALFTALPPIVVAGVASLLWGERLNAWQLLAFAVVISGLLMIKYSRDVKLDKLAGVQWGILTMLFFAFTDLTSKQATIVNTETLPLLAVMYGTGTLLFGVSWAIGKARSRGKSVAADTEPRPAEVAAKRYWNARRTFAWGMIVGITNIAGMLFVIPAFRGGVTGIVSAISAMNVIFVLLYAWLYLKERMSRREAVGLLLAIVGVLALRLAA